MPPLWERAAPGVRHVVTAVPSSAAAFAAIGALGGGLDAMPAFERLQRFGYAGAAWADVLDAVQHGVLVGMGGWLVVFIVLLIACPARAGAGAGAGAGEDTRGLWERTHAVRGLLALAIGMPLAVSLASAIEWAPPPSPGQQAALEVAAALLVLCGVATCGRDGCAWITAAAGGWGRAALIACVGASVAAPVARTLVAQPGATPVFILWVDSLRFDHVGAGVSGASRTPALDALGRDAVFFETALAASPATRESVVAATFSARPLPRRSDGSAADEGTLLLDAPASLAEILRGAGYRTTFVAAEPEVALEPLLHLGMDTVDHSAMHTDDVRHTGQDVRHALAAVRDGRADGGQLMVAHFADPAPPWHYPMGEDAGDYAGPMVQPVSGEDLRLHGLRMTDADHAYIRGMYAAQVRYADAQIGQLLDDLRAADSYDRALIVVAGTHGIGLDKTADALPGERSTLHPQNLHVPLWIKLPQGLHAGTSVATPVSLLDLAPTIVRLLSVHAPKGWQPRGRVIEVGPSPQPIRGTPPLDLTTGIPRPGVGAPLFAEYRTESRWQQSLTLGGLHLVRDLYRNALRMYDLRSGAPVDGDPRLAPTMERFMEAWFERAGDSWAVGVVTPPQVLHADVQDGGVADPPTDAALPLDAGAARP